MEKVKAENTCVTAEDIAVVVANWTSVPITKLNETESERLLNLNLFFIIV